MFESKDKRTVVSLELPDFGEIALGNNEGEIIGWFTSSLVAKLFESLGPGCFGDWFTDRRARRPSGALAIETYKDPLYHRPNFALILDQLRLIRDDYLIEIGCGGGAFLQEVLRSGCRAAAVDHSFEMVKLASEVNKIQIAEGRLRIVQGEADNLPFLEGEFTCAVMTGVFGFLEDPASVLSEIRRVLSFGGRLFVFTSSKELRGTPAAPEPIASRLHFYADAELEDLALEAWFAKVQVERPDLLEPAKRAGIPENQLKLFDGRHGQLMKAIK